MQRFEGQVQLVFYPYALNPISEVASQAVWCAGEQGKFWEFHHMLYRRQELWHRITAPLERLSDFAQDVGVDAAALKSCVTSGKMRARVQADKATGQQRQVQSTPTLFINDFRVVGGQSETELARLIRQELDRGKRPTP